MFNQSLFLGILGPRALVFGALAGSVLAQSDQRICDLSIGGLASFNPCTVSIQSLPNSLVAVLANTSVGFSARVPTFAGPIGPLGINLATAIDFSPFFAPTDATGQTSFTFNVPGLLPGLTIYMQAGVGDPFAPGGIALSQTVARTVAPPAPVGTNYIIPGTVLQAFPTGIAVGDIDADGADDFVVCEAGSPSQIYLSSTGIFTGTTPYAPLNPTDVTMDAALADLDNDNDLDLILTTIPLGAGAGVSRLHRHNGFSAAGLFLGYTEVPGAFASFIAAYQSLDVGDVDADGDLDVFLAVNTGITGVLTPQTSRLFLNQLVESAGASPLAFVDATATNLPAGLLLYTAQASFGDMDGDNDLDLVLANLGSLVPAPSVFYDALLLNNGAGVFTDATVGRMPLNADNTVSVELADFDADGDLDIAYGNFRALSSTQGPPQANRLYLNNGAAFFTDVTVPNLPDGNRVTFPLQPTNDLAVLDFDLDGDLDIFAANGVFGATPLPGVVNNLYVNNGNAVFTNGTALLPPHPTGGSYNTFRAEPITFPGIGWPRGTHPIHLILSDSPDITGTSGLGVVPLLR